MKHEYRIVLRDGKVLARFVGHDGYAVFKAALAECKRRKYSPANVWVEAPEHSGKGQNPHHYNVDSCPVFDITTKATQ